VSLQISSSDSEGAFNEFIEEQLDEVIDNILTEGSLESMAGRGSDIVVEVDGIEPPRFVHSDESDGQGGKGAGPGPGAGGEKIKFSLPFRFLMEKLAGRLNLPHLTKRGEGRIREWSEEFKTFGQVGVVMDRRRTFKRALKTSVALGTYAPQEDKYDISIMRRDRRFRQFEMVEKPQYKAVVFYMSDISYSTYGERMELEKKMVSFIQNWLDFNYGIKNVEHRFFVHDAKAYEVVESEFYNVSNAGGTRAAPVFELVKSVALSEYDPGSTNFYGFYFGDGELFDDDPDEIMSIIGDEMRSYFNRIGVVEVIPSSYSNLVKKLKSRFANDTVIRLTELHKSEQIVQVIKSLFKEGFQSTYAKH
jgi:uncharacterized sporulation protein YeaH/YhbH (DUF444 family)